MRLRILPVVSALKGIQTGFKVYNLIMCISYCPRRNITIMMGDFNAKIGRDNRDYEEIMGQHGLGEMNDNGERFAELCA